MKKERAYTKNIIRRAGAFILAMTMGFWMLPIGMLQSSAEAGVYITEIRLEQGDLSSESLEESGYSLIGQPLNPAGTTDLYLGYQTGGESGAIRDLMVSSSGSGSIEVEGISYQKVSDISLNEGAGGSALYLYASYDAQAGEPLRGLSFLVKKSPGGFEDNSSLLASDGSELVITDDGKPADFDEGIGESEIYLRMYKGNLYRPYVDDVIVATAGSEEAAIAELVVKRCTYYVNYDIGDKKSVFVGYTRTDDEEKALRALVAIGGDVSELAEAGESDDSEEADSEETDSDVGDSIYIKDVPYTPVEGGTVKSDRDYTFYMTKDKEAGEPVIDLIACGYDPAEFGLIEEPEKTEKPEETEEPAEAETPEDTETQEGEDGSSEDQGSTQDAESGSGDSDDGSGSDGSEEQQQEATDEGSSDTSESSEDGSTDTETVSELPVNRRALGTLCVAGLRVQVADEYEVEKVAELDGTSSDTGSDAADQSEDTAGDTDSDAAEPDSASETDEAPGSEDGSAAEDDQDASSESDDAAPSTEEDSGEEDETEESEGGMKLADAYRIYSETTRKDWISGYFLRGGGQAASKYLYDESEYVSASQSDEELWISNIYCSSKKGKQFVNYIGYVSAPGQSDGNPFMEAVPYSEADEEAKSTASVFDSTISKMALALMACAIIGAVIGSLVYKLVKTRKG